MPSVAQEALSSLECPGVLGAELLTPLSDGLVGDYDPALCQKVFNISEAQAESMIEPDGMADDIRSKSVSPDRLVYWCSLAKSASGRLKLTIPSTAFANKKEVYRHSSATIGYENCLHQL